MKARFIIITLAIVVLILFGLGAVLSEQCVNMGGCKACWKTTPIVVTSDLCVENKTCVAQPADQQNNAIADAVLCACEKAKAADYTNSELNSNIQNVISGFTSYNITASELCEQPGMFLARRSYG